MEHSEHNHIEATSKDYIKFALIILGIFLASAVLEWFWGNFDGTRYMREFMALFFLVFGMFKLYDINGFVSSYIGYDILAKRVKAYAYVYPFIELFLAFGYFVNWPEVNYFTIVITTIGAIGVAQQLKRKSNFRCACLGTYIKLPLTTVSLIEDLAMGAMALILLIQQHV